MDIFNFIAGAASIISLVVAIIQHQKYKATKKDYEKLRQIRNAQIWSNILLTLEAYNTLDQAKQKIYQKEVDQDLLPLIIISARKSLVAQYIKLLEQAVLDEDEFTEETAKEWRKKGLLENEWRYNAALRFVQNKSKLVNNSINVDSTSA